jgi:type II secretory pathway pseudopilin PulG
MKKDTKQNKSAGVGLIEIIIATSIIAIALSALAGLGNFSLKIQNRLQKNTMANYLASEAIEAARAVKDESWLSLSSLATDTALHPAQSGNPVKWVFSANSESIGNFSRQVIISNVNRDANDDITQSGGTLDANTKKITATIDWTEQGQSQQISLSTYLTNWQP